MEWREAFLAQSGGNPASDDRAADWLDVALARAAGAAPVSGNRIRVLRDGPENFPAWLEAIASAKRYVYFETYIFRGDRTGQQFVDALAARAREGVQVRVLYDWAGSFATPSRVWRTLRDAGAEVRCFNPFDWSSPLGWVHRDHRKTVSADGRVAFVSGLCVGDAWAGDPEKGVPPWRDTGVQIEGPAVADVEHAFARVWATVGAPIPEDERRRRAEIDPVGDTRLRVISDEPGTAGLLRLDQFIASAARRSLWITDAYFAGTPPYVQALRAAALDGVDVRLLVPGSSDIPALQPFSRAGFRALLEAGIRVFEWKGPMLHAKTAVCDGQWARVGSTNLTSSAGSATTSWTWRWRTRASPGRWRRCTSRTWRTRPSWCWPEDGSAAPCHGRPPSGCRGRREAARGGLRPELSGWATPSRPPSASGGRWRAASGGWCSSAAWRS